MTERNASLGQIIGRELKRNLVASENSDVMLAHLAIGISDKLMAIIELDAITGVRKHFKHLTGHFNKIFFCHTSCSP